MNNLIQIVQDTYQPTKKLPNFKAGDIVRVYLNIKDKNKDKGRIQKFEGTVLQCKGDTLANKTFTLRRVSNGVAVERIFPFCMPSIEKIEVVRKGIVRRARIFYLRGKYGNTAKIKYTRN